MDLYKLTIIRTASKFRAQSKLMYLPVLALRFQRYLFLLVSRLVSHVLTGRKYVNDKDSSTLSNDMLTSR